jgi:hypothetical protein
MNEQFSQGSISFTVNDDGTITATNNYRAEKYSWAVWDIRDNTTFFHSSWSEDNTFTFSKITRDSRYGLKAYVSGENASRVFFRFSVINGKMYAEGIMFTINDDGTITATNNNPAEKYSWAIWDYCENATFFHSSWSEDNTFTFPKITRDSRYGLKAYVPDKKGSEIFFKFSVIYGGMYCYDHIDKIQLPYERGYDESILNTETLVSVGYPVPIGDFSHLDDTDSVDINIEYESIFKRHGLDKFLLSNRVIEVLKNYADEVNKVHTLCGDTVGLCCSKRLYCTFLYLGLLNFIPRFLIVSEVPTSSYYFEDELLASKTKIFSIDDIKRNDQIKKDIKNIILIDDEISLAEAKTLFMETNNVMLIERKSDDILMRYYAKYYPYATKIAATMDKTNTSELSFHMMSFLGLLANSRDFVNLKDYISLVVHHKMVMWKQWLAVWLESQILIEKIKVLISKRTNVNHIVVFQDAFRYCGAEELNFKKFDNLTVGLENYYAFAAWTRQSFYSIVKGKSYFKYSADSKNKLLESVNKYGFDTVNIAEDARSGGLIVKESKTKKPTNPFPLEGHAPQECWKILVELCRTKTNSFIFAHSLAETHSGGAGFEFNKNRILSKKIEDFRNGIATENDVTLTYKDCATARLMNLSKQFDYYIPIITINPNNKLIITADHGQVPKWFLLQKADIPFCNYYQQEAYHIPFYLFNYDDKFKALKNVMLSHINFHKTLEALISEDISVLLDDNDHVRHEDLPAYGYLQKIVTNITSMTDEQLRTTNLCGAVSVTTRTDKYMFMADGRESYFILPHDYRPEHDLINESRHQARISYLRSLVERDFWDRFWNEHREYDSVKKFFLGDKSDKNGKSH